MQVYAMALEKGGVGKTSLAVNLAAAFSRVGLRVLLIDLDSQGHASHWLGIDPDSIRPDDSILGVFNGRPAAACVRTTAEGVTLLAAHPSMATLPIQVASAPNSGLFLLQDALTQINNGQPAYDIVILDLAPARGPVLATALAAATRCIVPVQAEDLVLRALNALRNSVAQAQRVNPQLRGISLVRNRYAPRSAGDMIYDRTLREHYGKLLMQTVIPTRAALRDATGLQQSVFTYTGSDASEVRNLFLNLVEELITLDGASS
jgi:chromosome partitioning protein